VLSQDSATRPVDASTWPTHRDVSRSPKACAARPDGVAGPGLVNREQVAREGQLLLENTVEQRSWRRAAKCKQRTITRARLFDESVKKGGFRGRWLMITFTYRDGTPWAPDHIATFWHRVRQWYRRQRIELRYTWTMELTGRGRPHYHALVWVPRHLMVPTPDKRGWWDQGMTRTEKARNAVGYLAKYASKVFGPCDPDGNEYLFPRGARICGGSRIAGDQIAEWRYWAASRWAREKVQPGTELKRVTGGYLVVSTGELLVSPWRFVGQTPDGKHLIFEARNPFGHVVNPFDHVRSHADTIAFWKAENVAPGCQETIVRAALSESRAVSREA